MEDSRPADQSNTTSQEPHSESRPASVAVDQHSEPFVGRWNQLVSNTNWEKGRIIHQWREALLNADAPQSEFADDAWARRVGGVTPQHVGRLRRVFHRFGDSHHQYEGLYWSHFQSAIDWDDAEMWLEGAVQSKWSISKMRKQRSETLGQPAEPDVPEEMDEDFESLTTVAPGPEEDPSPTRFPDDHEAVQGPRLGEGPDFGDEEEAPGAVGGFGDETFDVSADSQASPPDFRPFEHLPALPDDLAEAFDAYKLCILRHKAAEWAEVARDDLVFSLKALIALAEEG